MTLTAPTAINLATPTTTDSDPVPDAPEKLRYDAKRHAYWVDGKRASGASGAGKPIESTWNLDRWRTRKVLLGAALRADLAELAAAHPDDDRRLDDLVEQAIVAARGNEAANRGTAAHAHLDRHDNGLGTLTAFGGAVADQWARLLELHQLEVVDAERIVVLRRGGYTYCGRYDRVARHTPTGRLYLLDIKTGANAIRYPQSTAVQLAVYASAQWVAEGLDGDQSGETTRFAPAHRVDQSVALVAAITDTEARLVPFDVDVGRRWLDLAILVRDTQADDQTAILSDDAIPFAAAGGSTTADNATAVALLDQIGRDVPDITPRPTPTATGDDEGHRAQILTILRTLDDTTAANVRARTELAAKRLADLDHAELVQVGRALEHHGHHTTIVEQIEGFAPPPEVEEPPDDADLWLVEQWSHLRAKIRNDATLATRWANAGVTWGDEPALARWLARALGANALLVSDDRWADLVARAAALPTHLTDTAAVYIAPLPSSPVPLGRAVWHVGEFAAVLDAIESQFGAES